MKRSDGRRSREADQSHEDESRQDRRRVGAYRRKELRADAVGGTGSRIRPRLDRARPERKRVGGTLDRALQDVGVEGTADAAELLAGRQDVKVGRAGRRGGVRGRCGLLTRVGDGTGNGDATEWVGVDAGHSDAAVDVVRCVGRAGETVGPCVRDGADPHTWSTSARRIVLDISAIPRISRRGSRTEDTAGSSGLCCQVTSWPLVGIGTGDLPSEEDLLVGVAGAVERIGGEDSCVDGPKPAKRRIGCHRVVRGRSVGWRDELDRCASDALLCVDDGGGA